MMLVQRTELMLVHVLSSNGESVCYDPEKALQSLEDIAILPGLKYC
jgi:hypothetical protein